MNKCAASKVFGDCDRPSADLQCGLMNSKSQPNATEDAMTSRLSDGEAHHTLNCLSEDTAGPVNEDASEHFPSNLAPEASADSFVDVSPAAAEDEAILLSEAADFSPMDSPEHVSQEVSPEGSFDLADYHPTSSSFTSTSQCTEVVTDQVELDSATAGQQLNQDALIANHHVNQEQIPPGGNLPYAAAAEHLEGAGASTEKTTSDTNENAASAMTSASGDKQLDAESVIAPQQSTPQGDQNPVVKSSESDTPGDVKPTVHPKNTSR